MLQVPRVANRRVHIADMKLPWASNHALRHRMARRDHEIVARQVELLDSDRHQRQIRAVGPAGARQTLDK
jgi:hypothetical protein